ncbi:MAG TPA: hypothetical protein VN761_11540 [Candidatus Polarisedimenticolia bacterium]|nr:hypothetical protein [Candidatus Polarisedimenticolia bacterium]
MLTNILQMLHTTAAYQAAALQLMANEANFTAKQLGINESVPPPAAMDTNTWSVEAPPNGVGGSVSSANYYFDFHKGRLLSLRKIKWLENSSAHGDILKLADKPSLLDTNTVHEFAKEKLAAISVDVDALEKKFEPVIFQVPARRRDASGQQLRGVSNNVAVPLFMISWGEGPTGPLLRERLKQLGRPMRRSPRADPMAPVFMEILGTTKEVVELRVRDDSFSKRPPLQLTNASELLGPLPPPGHFVEELVGGPEAYKTIESPDKVQAWLLTSNSDNPARENKNRTGPVELKPSEAKAFSNALLNFDTYFWNVSKGCIVDYGARLRFTRGNNSVDVWLCFQCNTLSFSHDGKQNFGEFDNGRNPLVKALQSAFPKDSIVKDLQLNGKPSQ